jgi:LPXTG-motif cell wall-anchored protein
MPITGYDTPSLIPIIGVLFMLAGSLRLTARRKQQQ